LIQRQLKISVPTPEIKSAVFADSARPITAYTGTSFVTSGVAVSPYSGFLGILQGTGQGARVGNRIQTKRIRFCGAIRPRGYNVTSNPIPVPQYVRLLIVNDADNANTLAAISNDFFQNGSSNIAPDGTMNDIYSDVNTDRWTVYHDQVFKVGYATSGGTGIQVASQSYTNNDFLLSADFDVDVTKFASKIYDFDDNTSLPKNKTLCAYFFCASYDGNAGVAATNPCNVTMHMCMDFVDV
jgi:hypothetical protein